MKTLILMTTLLLSLNSFGRSLHPDTFKPRVYVAEINKIQIDDNFTQLGHIDGGTITVNLESKMLKLDLVDYQKCPAGMMCTLDARKPRLVTVQLPILTSAIGFCGGTFYVAQVDLRNMGGHLHTIQVFDNSNLICGATEEDKNSSSATYSVQNSNTTLNAYFGATKLMLKAEPKNKIDVIK